jgi:ADP-ribose pyrophosphatase
LINTIYPSPGYCSETLYIYLATGLTPGDAHLDDGEHLSCECLLIDDLVDRIARGEICDAKTVVGLLMTHKLLKDRQTGRVHANERITGSIVSDGET